MKFELSKEHIASKNRERRVIIRLDALGEHIIHQREMSEEDYFSYLFDMLDNTDNQVDTIFWDIMYGADFSAMYDSKIISKRNSLLKKFKCDFIGKILLESKKRGYENFIVNRISEVIVDPEIPDVFHNHPEYFIKSWYELGTNNLAVDEVRKYKLSVIEEVLRLYDFDGIDIDFARHTPFLEAGKQWELRENVTEFLRELRKMTLSLEKEKNKPVLVSARVPDSVFLANQDGIDVEQIAKEQLLDLLTLGSRSINVDVQGYKNTVGDDIKLYPCHDSEHASDGYMFPNIEITRGIFSSWWQMGADGVQTFNHHTQRDCERAKTFKKYNFKYLEPEWCCQEKAYLEIGDYSKMKTLDKTFVVERRGGYPWGEGLSYNNETKQLPLPLKDSDGSNRISIYSSDDISANTNKKATLSLVLYGLSQGDKISVDFDGAELVDIKYDFNHSDPQISAPNPPVISGGRVRENIVNNICVSKLLKVDFNVPNHLVTVGHHTVCVSLKKAFDNSNEQGATVEKVELSIKTKSF